jgi:gas vesicle protein
LHGIVRQEAEISVMSVRGSHTYVGMALLGGLFGLALGLLVAPGPGIETRRRMSGRSSVADRESLLRRADMAAELLADELDLPASA